MGYFFQRYLIAKDWDESKHPRGKTVEGTNTGSFASEDTPQGSLGLSNKVGERKYKSMERVSELDKEVKESPTPAQTLHAQFGPLPSEQEVLAELQRRIESGQMVGVPKDAWKTYVEESKKADEALKAAGGETRNHYATKLEGQKDEYGNQLYKWDEDREQLVHNPVIEKYVQEYMDKAALTEGQAEVVILAGRGGSGKSGFGTGKEGDPYFIGFYDNAKYVVIDPDEIKKDLAKESSNSGKYNSDSAFNPKTTGAAYWHEESSHIAKRIQLELIDLAKSGAKANVVLDLTLSSDKTKELERFKSAGFFITGANINVPIIESASNALQRYLRPTPDGPETSRGRLVPLSLIANSRKNELNFDKLAANRKLMDSWHMYTAGVPSHRLVTWGGKKRPGGKK